MLDSPYIAVSLASALRFAIRSLVVSCMVVLAFVSTKLRNNSQKYVATDFIYCKPGVFKEITGVEELKRQDVISDFYIFKWVGAEFDTIQNSGDRVAGFTIVGDSIEEMNSKHDVVLNTIKVLDENNQDIMRKDLLPSF